MRQKPTLTIKDYLEAASDSVKRTRTVTIVLVVATVLTFVGYLNSREDVWMLDRIAKVADRDGDYIVTKLRKPHSEEWVRLNYQPAYIDKHWMLMNNEQFDNPIGPYADQIKASQNTSQINELTEDQKNDLYNKKFKELKAAYDKEHEQLYGEMVKAYVDNTLLIRAPFFGITFDVNDLYLLSGIAFTVILLLLNFSLGRELSNVQFAFGAAELLSRNELRSLYNLLAMRQMFTFPPLPHHHSKPRLQRLLQPVLRLAPHVIVFLPALAYGRLVYHDNVQTRYIARTISQVLADWQLWLSVLFLAVILSLTLICFSTWLHIDKVWANYGNRLHPAPTNTPNRDDWQSPTKPRPSKSTTQPDSQPTSRLSEGEIIQ